jgi:hypothetical protein
MALPALRMTLVPEPPEFVTEALHGVATFVPTIVAESTSRRSGTSITTQLRSPTS